MPNRLLYKKIGVEYMEINGINPIKQNTRIKQFFGWFITIVFPFALRGISETTKIPVVGALLYWGICGVLLRIVMNKKLPYFNIQWQKVKKEIIVLAVLTIICCYSFISGFNIHNISMRGKGASFILIAFLNGSFEPLVWINIFDLAGSKYKSLGLLASFVYITLIHGLFWGQFISVPELNNALFILAQVIIFIVPLIIYIKTKDITIWSIQRVIYNIFVVFFCDFAINIFLHL